MNTDKNIEFLNFCVSNRIESIATINDDNKYIYGMIVITPNYQSNKIYLLSTSELQYEHMKAHAINSIKYDNTIIDCEGYIRDLVNPLKVQIETIYKDYIKSKTE